MSTTRDTLVLRCRQMADAVNATGDWPSDFVLALASTVLDNEWTQLLATAPWLRTSPRSVTLDATGIAPLAQLDGGAGDTKERLYRVREVRYGGREFVFVHPSRIAHVDSARYAGMSAWTIDGGVFQVFGAPGGATVDVRVSHLPPVLTDLADGNSLVAFPDTGVTLLAMETAALMLMRGAREGDEAVRLQMQGEVLRQKLHDAVARSQSGPTFLRAADDASEWAG